MRPVYAQIRNKALNIFGEQEGSETIAQLIASFLTIAFSIAGLILLTMLIWGAFDWMTAGGDKAKYEGARKKISSALIGFVIFMSIFAVINIIAPIFGLDFLQILEFAVPTPE